MWCCIRIFASDIIDLILLLFSWFNSQSRIPNSGNKQDELKRNLKRREQRKIMEKNNNHHNSIKTTRRKEANTILLTITQSTNKPNKHTLAKHQRNRFLLFHHDIYSCEGIRHFLRSEWTDSVHYVHINAASLRDRRSTRRCTLTTRISVCLFGNTIRTIRWIPYKCRGCDR